MYEIQFAFNPPRRNHVASENVKAFRSTEHSYCWNGYAFVTVHNMNVYIFLLSTDKKNIFATNQRII